MILHGFYEVADPNTGKVLTTGPATQVRSWGEEYLGKSPSETVIFCPVNVYQKRHWWQKDTATRDPDRMLFIGFIPKGGKKVLIATVEQYRRWQRHTIGMEVIILNNEHPYARMATLKGFHVFPQGEVFPLVAFADGQVAFSMATILTPTKHTRELLDNPEYAAKVWDAHMMLTACRI